MGLVVVVEDVWLCSDCMQYAVNGDLPPDNAPRSDRIIEEGVAELGPHLVPDFGEQPRKFECSECDKEFAYGQIHVHDAMLSQCPSCMEPDNPFRETTRDNGEDEFSNRMCAGCNTLFAGARYRFAILGEEPK